MGTYRNILPAHLVERASYTASPPKFVKKAERTGMELEGERYESLVQKYLKREYPDTYFASPWLRFIEAVGERYCQPDGVYADSTRKHCVIVEIKRTHTIDSWPRLVLLYLPVVKKLPSFRKGDWTFSCLTIVNFYREEPEYPPHSRVSGLGIELPETHVGVWVLKPKMCLAAEDFLEGREVYLDDEVVDGRRD